MRNMRSGFSSIPFFACLCLTFAGTAQIRESAKSFLPPAAQIRFDFQQMVLPLPDNCRECLEKRYTKTLEIEGTKQQIVVDSYAVSEPCRDKKEFHTTPWEHCWAYKVSLVDMEKGSKGQAGPEQAPPQRTIYLLSRCSFDRGADCRIILINGTRLLLLPDSTGGNCVNCDSSLVLSLQPEDMLEVCGNATLREETGSGKPEIVVAEDCAEDTAWLCHAMSPCPFVYCKLKNGKLVPDREKCLRNWKKDMAKNRAEIATFLNEKNEEDWPLRVYCRLLDNYLMGYLAGKEKKALSELRKGLEPLTDDQSRIVMGMDSKAVFSDFEQEVHEVTAKVPDAAFK